MHYFVRMGKLCWRYLCSIKTNASNKTRQFLYISLREGSVF